MSGRAERAREYSRRRWRFYSQLGQLQMIESILSNFYWGGKVEENAILARQHVYQLRHHVNVALEAMNKRQRKEIEDED